VFNLTRILDLLGFLQEFYKVHVGAWLMHLFMVHDDYRLFGIGWCMVDALVYGTGSLQVDWYRFTMVYLTVIVLQWFHHSTYNLGQLDRARIGGCSHLSVVAGEHRGL
jgi:hypothetical protein